MSHTTKKAPTLVGTNPQFRRQIDAAIQAARTDCNILILGETGTGKELVARTIHHHSPRRAGPFLAINCGSFTRDLIGSELFGHERGAFTGATDHRQGLFVRANRGSLFLDELGELPLEQQPLLLRALETQRIRPLGATREYTFNVRVIAATNRVEAKPSNIVGLRADLFHRIATIVVRLIPLRERREDIPAIVDHTLTTQKFGPRFIAPTTMQSLCDYSWPGNVRELIQSIRRASILCDNELTLDHLLPVSGPAVPIRPLSIVDASVRQLMTDALAIHGTFRGAARALGIPKSTFADRAQRLGLRSRHGSRATKRQRYADEP